MAPIVAPRPCGNVEELHVTAEAVACTALLTMTQQSTGPVGDQGEYSHVEQLFRRLADADDDEERSEWRRQIILACLPLADHIAYRFMGRGEPSEDLIQVARLALIRTIDRYDSTKGRFLPFAFSTIFGQLRRYFRDNTWAMHVPRGIKDTHRRVRAAIDPLSQRLGRAPTAAELAAELELDREQISWSIDAAHAYHPISLDAPAPASSTANYGIGSHQGVDDPRYDAVEDAMALARLISQLPARQQLILKMRYCDCLTQAQIGHYFGISQVHVSRLLTATLECLRAQLVDGSPGESQDVLV